MVYITSYLSGCRKTIILPTTDVSTEDVYSALYKAEVSSFFGYWKGISPVLINGVGGVPDVQPPKKELLKKCLRIYAQFEITILKLP